MSDCSAPCHRVQLFFPHGHHPSARGAHFMGSDHAVRTLPCGHFHAGRRLGSRRVSRRVSSRVSSKYVCVILMLQVLKRLQPEQKNETVVLLASSGVETQALHFCVDCMRVKCSPLPPRSFSLLSPRPFSPRLKKRRVRTCEKPIECPQRSVVKRMPTTIAFGAAPNNRLDVRRIL